MRKLAEKLGVTSNAVRDHVDVLRERGLVEATGLQRGTGGKPARIYELTATGEDSFGAAYLDVLLSIVDSLERSVGEEELERVLDDAGRRLGRELAPAGNGFERRVREAAAVLNDMGGMAEVDVFDEGATITSAGCPVSALVRDHPGACRLAVGLIGEITSGKVHEECQRGARPSCRFTIARPEGAESG